VAGTLDSLEAIAKYTIEAARHANLDRKTAYKLRLAMDELATNIIVHGYREAHREGILTIQAELSDRVLKISSIDTGIPYNPTLQKQPDNLDRPLNEREIGGLGVYLVRENVDRWTYQRVGDRNINTLTIDRHSC